MRKLGLLMILALMAGSSFGQKYGKLMGEAFGQEDAKKILSVAVYNHYKFLKHLGSYKTA